MGSNAIPDAAADQYTGRDQHPNPAADGNQHPHPAANSNRHPASSDRLDFLLVAVGEFIIHLAQKIHSHFWGK
jgi:hypothetical protein